LAVQNSLSFGTAREIFVIIKLIFLSGDCLRVNYTSLPSDCAIHATENIHSTTKPEGRGRVVIPADYYCTAGGGGDDNMMDS